MALRTRIIVRTTNAVAAHFRFTCAWRYLSTPRVGISVARPEVINTRCGTTSIASSSLRVELCSREVVSPFSTKIGHTTHLHYRELTLL
ncbi:hypothetical protein TSAR_005039 [Trichomalopsis sarcophagae]|uniref:Uncharacterized protein n=1 Tax=Trichomalopsis sarcophagae TaxID=543379 RepID=A0A232F8L1_9HYME|nr:hypothetical protein TSAR_005039 [Trichomalopsis sarcophagae]